MSLAPEGRLGAYEVIAQIGVGGMGEVYRALDTNLGRHVAIKVLPDSVAHDPEPLARFEREAKTLASLNHPNIAIIHGLEKADGIRALVMELVEGPTLADRIAQGPIPLDEALPIARQIAEALEAAHEQGIIHRDLKPANIKVREDGSVKVLDFGLAKALDSTSAIDATQSPTITSPAMMTGVGVLLGTAAYMSPEQARGKPADKRADIWAFGCVLYEMLTGRRAFEGEDVSDTLANVLKAHVDWSALPGTSPPAIRRLLRRSLEKDRKRRTADIADARMDIDDASTEPATTSIVAETNRRTRWTAALASTAAATMAVVLTVLVLRTLSPQPVAPDRPVIRMELILPTGVEAQVVNAQAAAISPDGTSVAFIGILSGMYQIFLRRLDQFQATPLVRGGLPVGCFFSPDGRSLGFFDLGSRTLKKVSLTDALVVPLASDVDYSGGVWGLDDRLTFTRMGELWQVPGKGGAATQLTRLDKAKGELSHNWPTLTPDGKVLLFTVVTGSGRDAAHIEALTLATGQRQVVVNPGTFPLSAPSRHLIFFRNNALFAAPFDVTRAAVTGPHVRVLDDVAVDGRGAPIVAVAQAGGLVYLPASAQATSRIVWVSRRQALEQPLDDTPRQYQFPRLAPDGEHVVVSSAGDLWILDRARKTFPRLTSTLTTGNTHPVWTADGTRVVFRTRTGLAWIAADGSRRTEAIEGTSGNDYPTSVSPDSGTLAFTRINSETGGDIYTLSLRGEANPLPVIKSPAVEAGAQFSPNGRWLAYGSNETGQMQVYVRPFPGPGGKVIQVSTQGGTQPRWNPNGKELFYRNENRMMVVDVTASPDLAFSSPRMLFPEQRYAYGVGGTIPNYDVSPDGQHFVMVKDESASGRLNVVLNWTEELKRLVPGK